MRNGMWKVALAVATFVAPMARAETPDADEIVRRANLAAYYAGADGRATVNMSITDRQGRERTREFVILRRNKAEGGDQLFYVHFNAPADVRRMAFLVWKNVGRDDDRWLYLPALDLVKRIAASDKRTSFVGSDFLYEDVSGRGVDEDAHELVETTTEHFVVRNTPRSSAGVEFADYTVWIDRTTFLPLKAEYRNAAGEIYRTVTAVERGEVQGHPTILRSEVRNLETGSVTKLAFTNVQYDIGLEESVFTERYLRRPPREIR